MMTSGRQVESMNEQALRTVLRVNASTSLLGGAAAAIAPRTIDGLLDTGQPGWIRVTGIGLTLFAVWVVTISNAPTARLRRGARDVSFGDAAWVIGTVATIAAGWYSMRGAVMVGLVGAMVAVFGARQAMLRRSLAVGHVVVQGASAA